MFFRGSGWFGFVMSWTVVLDCRVMEVALVAIERERSGRW